MTPSKLLSAVLSLIVIGGAIAIVAGVPAAALTPLAIVLTVVAWISVIPLARAAVRRPRIGLLSERAAIAVVIALFGTTGCIIATNTDRGRPYFDAAVASVLFRVLIVAILAIPSVWVYLYATGKLGQGK